MNRCRFLSPSWSAHTDSYEIIIRIVPSLVPVGYLLPSKMSYSRPPQSPFPLAVIPSKLLIEQFNKIWALTGFPALSVPHSSGNNTVKIITWTTASLVLSSVIVYFFGTVAHTTSKKNLGKEGTYLASASTLHPTMERCQGRNSRGSRSRNLEVMLLSGSLTSQYNQVIP